MNYKGQNLNWIDYSALSVIEGFASYEFKKILYCRAAPKICYCQYYLRGESNSVNTGFSLPLPVQDIEMCSYLVGTMALSVLLLNANIVGAVAASTGYGVSPSRWELMYGIGGIGTWGATGLKDCRGHFWFQTT